MVFKHNKQPFADDVYYQFANNHQRQLDCGTNVASVAELNSFMGIHEKHHMSDGEKEGSSSQTQVNVMIGGETDIRIPNDEFGSRVGDMSNYFLANALCNVSSLPQITGSSNEPVRSGNLKRTCSNNVSCEVQCKRARHGDQDSLVDTYEKIHSFNLTTEGAAASVADVGPCSREDNDARENASGSTRSMPWFTCSTAEEDTRLEPPRRLFSLPGYFEDGHQTFGFKQSEEIRSPVVLFSPRKLVPIGPDHQAELPLWRPQGSKNISECFNLEASYSASAGHLMVHKDTSDRWMGTCILPMPDSGLLASVASGRNNKTECSCPDKGSIRCVRQHVMEARARLQRMLGQDRFRELGFNDMGVDVAHLWAEEEQQLFHEVVLSNPASLGKNFWDTLSQAFPFHTMKQLVSYYFNVFMLRKRALQNRVDPSNVDSDNDEWEESDDGESASTEEDSVVESPADYDDAICNNVHKTQVYSSEDSEDGDDYDDCTIACEEDERLYRVSERCTGNKSGSVPETHSMGKTAHDSGENQDAEDDSCTSFEGKVDLCGGPVDFVGRHDSLVDCEQLKSDGLIDQDFLFSPCDPRTWEMNYVSQAGNDPRTWEVDFVPQSGRDADLLPTCSVIEEVFGKGY